ncbi:helix-turn-helix domain-containing protein, partial [uncultured Muribaculum sp.]|uniref:helix-turn-helix domain-containing protein n=1 Tax=uncultured Muribaculum sp. TaxID=1918613 RepID=UPI0025AEF581
MSAGDFICIFGSRFGRRGIKPKKHEHKIKKILLCHASGMGIKGISSAFDISRNTVRRYVRMYQDSGIPAEKLRLQELFAIPGARERKPSERQVRLEALLPDYAARLSRKGMTVKKLYEEYHTDHPDGYLKASFGMKLRQFMLQTNAIGHVEHRAGDQMYIDFAGDRLEIVDEATAGIRKVEVFVAILPC